jgi:hypothetical protein
MPYYAACLFSCEAGAFDPLGLKLFVVSTIPAAFGGLPGLIWADSLLPQTAATEPKLVVHREIAWWIATAVIETCILSFSAGEYNSRTRSPAAASASSAKH